MEFLDLFSGIGGFRLALELASQNQGINPICKGFSEIDKFAVQTYKANFVTNSSEVEIGNITNITKLMKDQSTKDCLSTTQLVFAGLPCQPFSIFGNGLGLNDKRGNLFYNLLELLDLIKPTFLLLENVRGLKYHNSGKTLTHMTNLLNSKGYSTIIWEMNTADYGLPQIRRRIFLLIFNRKVKIQNLRMPTKIDQVDRKYPTSWHLLEQNVDNKYYLSDKIKKTILSNGSGKFRYKSEINRLTARPLTATMHKMHRANQDNYYSNDFIKGQYNLKENDIFKTPIGKDSIRRITPREAFRLQGYPDHFVDNAKSVGISDTQLYRQAGNSISIDVVVKILNAVFNSTNLLELGFSN